MCPQRATGQRRGCGAKALERVARAQAQKWPHALRPTTPGALRWRTPGPSNQHGQGARAIALAPGPPPEPTCVLACVRACVPTYRNAAMVTRDSRAAVDVETRLSQARRPGQNPPSSDEAERRAQTGLLVGGRGGRPADGGALRHDERPRDLPGGHAKHLLSFLEDTVWATLCRRSERWRACLKARQRDTNNGLIYVRASLATACATTRKSSVASPILLSSLPSTSRKELHKRRWEVSKAAMRLSSASPPPVASSLG